MKRAGNHTARHAHAGRHAHACVGMLAFLLAFLAGCSRPSDDSAGPVRVCVSILPQASLVQQIGGDRVAVQSMAGSGQDPHTFEPTPKQVIQAAKCRLFFTVGMPFETRLAEKIAAGSNRLVVVDTTQSIHRDLSASPHGDASGHEVHEQEQTHEQANAHSHEHEHEHAEPSSSRLDPPCDCCADGDPHVWLSPPALKIQAAAIAKALCEADPSGKETYDANLERLVRRLDALDARARERLAPFRGRTIYVHHPALGHFCAAFGLVQKAVQLEGRDPSARRIRQLIEQARADGVKVIFVQRQFDDRSARLIAEAIGGVVAPLDPLAPDVLKNIEEITEAIAGALAQEAGGKESGKTR